MRKRTSYVQELQSSLESLVRGSQLRLSPDTSGVSGKIVLLRGDLSIRKPVRDLQTVARAVLLSRRGTLAEQMTRSHSAETIPPLTGAARPSRYPTCRCRSNPCNFSTGWVALQTEGANM